MVPSLSLLQVPHWVKTCILQLRAGVWRCFSNVRSNPSTLSFLCHVQTVLKWTIWDTEWFRGEPFWRSGLPLKTRRNSPWELSRMECHRSAVSPLPQAAWKAGSVSCGWLLCPAWSLSGSHSCFPLASRRFVGAGCRAKLIPRGLCPLTVRVKLLCDTLTTFCAFLPISSGFLCWCNFLTALRWRACLSQFSHVQPSKEYCELEGQNKEATLFSNVLPSPCLPDVKGLR